MSKQYKKGFTAGVFDLFHVGHLNLLRNCKETCEYLMVGVLTDDFVYQMKGAYPYITLADRMEIIASIKYVDEVVPVDYHNTHKPTAWQLYHFDCCYSGDDHQHEECWKQEALELRLLGSEMVFLPYTQRVSSSMIKENVNKTIETKAK